MNIVILQETVLPGIDLHHNPRMIRKAFQATNARMDEYSLLPLQGMKVDVESPDTTSTLRGMTWHVT